MLRRIAPVAVTLALSLSLGGCAREVHRPRPLAPDATAAALESRSLASPALRDYLVAQGQPVDPWPRAIWDLPALTLAAVFHHADIEVARARARVAAAERQTSRTRVPWTLTARPEYDSRENGATPWGLGVLAGLPLDIGGKRAIRSEQLQRLENAAGIEVGVAAWRVRSRLRRHFADLHLARVTLGLLEAEQAERVTLARLIDRRVAVGYAAETEASAIRLRLAEGDLALRRAAIRQDQALAGVAEAAGLPLEEVRATRFDFAAVATLVPAPTGTDLQRAALLNRIDLRRKLADYAAAEAAVKLEVARQYPDLTLAPGYLWDADQSVWSLAFLAVIPPAARTKALIREAEARREVEEKAFVAMQAGVIAEAQAAASRYQRALAAHTAARGQVDAAVRRREQVQRQFEGGHVDRVELTLARVEAAVAERTAVVAMLELQQGLSALEDALQRPLDNPDLMASAQAVAATPADPGINPALIDND